jgi:hypothetical protein
MIYTAKTKRVLLDRPVARRMSRYLKGQGMVTQSNHVSPKPVRAMDEFDIHIFHPQVLDKFLEEFKHITRNQFNVSAQ